MLTAARHLQSFIVDRFKSTQPQPEDSKSVTPDRYEDSSGKVHMEGKGGGGADVPFFVPCVTSVPSPLSSVESLLRFLVREMVFRRSVWCAAAGPQQWTVWLAGQIQLIGCIFVHVFCFYSEERIPCEMKPSKGFPYGGLTKIMVVAVSMLLMYSY